MKTLVTNEQNSEVSEKNKLFECGNERIVQIPGRTGNKKFAIETFVGKRKIPFHSKESVKSVFTSTCIYIG